jgi:integrase
MAQLTSDPTVGEVFRGYVQSIPEPKRRDYALKVWGPIQFYWRTLLLSEVSPKRFSDFYQWCRSKGNSNHTVHKKTVVIRQILKYAMDQELLAQMPRVPAIGKIPPNPRPWLTPLEWQHLERVAQTRILAAADLHRWGTVQSRMDLREFAQMMVLTCCRVDELRGLRYGDCEVDPESKVLRAHVTGKTGPRTLKAPAEAGRIVLARLKQFKATPEQRIFPGRQHQAFRTLLIAAGLLTNADGFERNLKSLRATAISFRILKGRPKPDLIGIARNAGTSIAQIDKHYAKPLEPEHFSDTLIESLDSLVGDSLD